jgi:quercetin dioxygenase-like cupin family protein
MKETEDRRGKIIWLDSADKEIHVVETKKGFSRGGHHHPFDSIHLLISGQIIYREYNLEDGKEISRTVKPVETIFTAANRAHMIIATEDSVLIEIFDQAYKATDFPKYRQIVDDALK